MLLDKIISGRNGSHLGSVYSSEKRVLYQPWFLLWLCCFLSYGINSIENTKLFQKNVNCSHLLKRSLSFRDLETKIGWWFFSNFKCTKAIESLLWHAQILTSSVLAGLFWKCHHNDFDVCSLEAIIDIEAECSYSVEA